MNIKGANISIAERRKLSYCLMHYCMHYRAKAISLYNIMLLIKSSSPALSIIL